MNSSPSTIGVIRIKDRNIGEACSKHGGDKKCVKMSVGKSEGKNHSEGLGVDWNVKITGS
jgi:hypothetical protein